MDNYVIRIYRRDPDDPRKIVGMAESVERDEKRNFTDFGQLQEFICRARTTEDRGASRVRTAQRRK